MSDRVLQHDHIEPLSRGGEHSLDNTALACHRCNARKGNRFLLEWALDGDAPFVRGSGRRRGRVACMRMLREEGHTLAAIGTLYGISRERVRQLLTKRED